MQDFKHIRAWQRAHALGIVIHRVARPFTRAGHAHLRAQLTRSADAISSTIVEGAGTDTNHEFARYLNASIKAANETEERLLTARDHGLIDDDLWSKLTGETIEVRKMTYGYRKAVLESARREEEAERRAASRKRARRAIETDRALRPDT